MSDYLFTFLWMLTLASPSFIIQLIMLFKVNNKYIRYIFFLPSVIGFWIAFDGCFRITGLVTDSWPELAAFIVAVYTAIYTLGLVLAIIVYKSIQYRNNKKR